MVRSPTLNARVVPVSVCTVTTGADVVDRARFLGGIFAVGRTLGDSVLLAPGGRPGIIPDIAAAVPMPAALPHRDARTSLAGAFSGM